MRRGVMRSGLMSAMLVLGVWCAGGYAADEAGKGKLTPIQPEEVKLGRPVDFEQDIFPFLEANCISCHNLAVKENNLNLEDLPNIMKGGKHGASVIPRDPDKSLLYRMAAHIQGPIMPPIPNKVEAATLTPKQLGLLRQWILEGAGAGTGGSASDIPWQAPSVNSQAIYSLAVTGDGQFAACGRSNQIYVYHLPSEGAPSLLVDPQLSELKNGDKPFYPAPPAHRDLIHALAFSPDGSTLASGDYRTVKLWKRSLNAVRHEFTVQSVLRAVSVSADGKWGVTGGVDYKVQLWDLESGKPGPVCQGHSAAVTGVAFSPDGNRVYSASLDKTVRVWGARTGQLLGQISAAEPLHCLAVHPKGEMVAAGEAAGTVQLWSVSAGDKPAFTVGKVLKGHTKPLVGVAFFGTAGDQVLSGAEDGNAILWKWADGTQVRTVNHGAPVSSVAAKPDGSQFLTVGGNHVRLWQGSDGKQLAELRGDVRAERLVAKVTADHRDATAAIATAEAALKSAETELKAKEESVKKAEEALKAAEKSLKEATDKVPAAQQKAEAAKKASEAKKDDAALTKAKQEADKGLTDAQAALKTATEAHMGSQRALEASRKTAESGKGLVTTEKGSVELAKGRQAKVAAQLKVVQEAASAAAKPLRAAGWSRDGKLIASVGDDSLVHTWRADGSPLEVLVGHKAPVLGVTFAQGTELLSVSADQTLRQWQLSPTWKLFGQIGPKPDAPLDLKNSPFVDRVIALALSPDGKLLATGGGDPSRSGQLMLWDTENLTLVKNLSQAHSDVVMGIEFSRDGTHLVSCGSDKFVRILDVASGKTVKSFEGHTNHVLDVAFQGNGVILASAGADNAIKVWSLETGEQVRTIASYSKQVTGIQFVGRTNTFISCGGDGTVRLFNADNGAQVRAFGGASDYLYTVASTEDEKFVLAGGEDGNLRVWSLADGASRNVFPPLKQTPQVVGK